MYLLSDLPPKELIFIIVGFAIILIFVLLIRWLFRIDEIVNILKEIRDAKGGNK